MKKILLVSDSPYATSGLARISRSLIEMLPEFEWVVWGMLHPDFNVRKGMQFPYYDPADFKAKFRILTPKSYTDDQFGFELVPGLIEAEKPDFLITTVDFDRFLKVLEPIKKLQFTLDFKWINYFPMDRVDYFDEEVEWFRFPDVNVCYSEYGRDRLHQINPKLDIKAIRCAINVDEFPTIPQEEIDQFRAGTWKGVNQDTFLVGSVNRSFARKDTARLVRAFANFLNETPNSYAYIHGSSMTFEKVDLAQLAYQLKTPPGRLAFMPKGFTELQGVSQQVLNKLYQSMNLFVTVSCGEGFGYTAAEALLAGVPVIAPNHTTFPEVVGGFGYLVEPSEMAYQYNGSTVMWPVVNVDDVVKTMKKVKKNYPEAKERALAGQKWAREHLNYTTIGNQWREILK